MAEAIPKLREQIKDASMSELKDFLESIRKHSTKIGEVAMKHVGLNIDAYSYNKFFKIVKTLNQHIKLWNKNCWF